MENKTEITEIIDTPFFFSLKVVSNNRGIKMVSFVEKQYDSCKFDELSVYSKALIRYFDGEKINFLFPYELNGVSNFDLKVFEEVKKIDYGQTKTYKDIAVSLGNKKLARAVGNSLRKNPIPIIIPCHRVIGSDGTLKGFIGKEGIEIKTILLRLERNNI